MMKAISRPAIFFLLLTACSGGKPAPSHEDPEADAAEPDEPPAADAGGKPAPKDAAAPATPLPDADSVSASDTGTTTPSDTGTPPSPSDASPPPTEEPTIPGCTLKWSPSAMRDGDNAFEAAEMPDIQFPGGSPGTHQGVKHLSFVPEHDAYRIDSHYSPPGMVDFDRVTQTGPARDDRLRCETRGMVDSAGKQVDMLNGETWRFTWSFYMPASLKGTSRFTHIMQMKYLDKGGGASGSPIVTLTLRPNDRIELLLWLGGGSVSVIDASALHDKWLTADLTMKIAPAGNVHWVFKDGDKVLVDKQQNGTIWPSDGARLRPKWGIYRGIAAGVQSTYILLSALKAYKCQ
jgi:hypothetical protein